METCRRIKDLIDFIAGKYTNAVEIGIGRFPDIAFALLDRGVSVFATDIQPFHYRGLTVAVDDITWPDLSLYDGTDLIYSMRPPPELVPYMVKLAKRISSDLIIKHLSSEYIEGCRLIRNGNTTFFIWNYSRKIYSDRKK